MKERISALIEQAISKLMAQDKLGRFDYPRVNVEKCQNDSHGDFASNIALICAKRAGMPPRKFAELVLSALENSNDIVKTEIAGPGFINFFLNFDSNINIVSQVLKAKEQYGLSNLGKDKKVNLEFVSTNPTGPLHVGHGRGAAIGSALANLLNSNGFKVHREYYLNDAGRQMDILATSVWLRYLELLSVQLPFPANAYRGKYIIAIAEDLKTQHQNAFATDSSVLLQDLPADAADGGDKETYIDAIIQKAKTILTDNYQTIFDFALAAIVADIKDDLREFRVEFDAWFSERQLYTDNSLQTALNKLEQDGHTYSKEGAIWFKATSFGDDKDRVLVRANGSTTYFASDVAYHLNKLARGSDFLIDIMGADHHGYINRLKGLLSASGITPEKLEILIVQFATLYRGKEKIQMSTRSGEFVTLRELRKEVGNDATRFFYVMRKADQHVDFDLEVAKSQSNENPVFYIQYAHARIASIFTSLASKEVVFDQNLGLANLSLLTDKAAQNLAKKIADYPDIIKNAVQSYGVHKVAQYLRELATSFHSYYNAQQIIVADTALCNARLCLIKATQQIFKNALTILGVSAPNKM